MATVTSCHALHRCTTFRLSLLPLICKPSCLLILQHPCLLEDAQLLDQVVNIRIATGHSCHSCPSEESFYECPTLLCSSSRIQIPLDCRLRTPCRQVNNLHQSSTGMLEQAHAQRCKPIQAADIQTIKRCIARFTLAWKVGFLQYHETAGWRTSLLSIAACPWTTGPALHGHPAGRSMPLHLHCCSPGISESPGAVWQVGTSRAECGMQADQRSL